MQGGSKMEITREQTRMSNEIKILLNDVKHLETNIQRMNLEIENKKERITYFKKQMK